MVRSQTCEPENVQDQRGVSKTQSKSRMDKSSVGLGEFRAASCQVAEATNSMQLQAIPSSMIESGWADKLKYSVPRIKLLLVHEMHSTRRVTIKSPADAAKLLKPLKHAAEEMFVSIHLNAKNEVVGLHEVSHGTLSASLVHPREVFKAALLANSYAILVCHNHPSGSTVSPSPEDMETTKQLVDAGKLLGVSVVDHLIVGPRTRDYFYSIRERHPTLWS